MTYIKINPKIKELKKRTHLYANRYAIALYDEDDNCFGCYSNLYDMAKAFNEDYKILSARFAINQQQGSKKIHIGKGYYKYYFIDYEDKFELYDEKFKKGLEKMQKEREEILKENKAKRYDATIDKIENIKFKYGDYFVVDVQEYINDCTKMKRPSKSIWSYRYNELETALRMYRNYKISDVICNVWIKVYDKRGNLLVCE